jgi:hypothetical protein
MPKRDPVHLNTITIRPSNRDRAHRARAAVTAYRKSMDTNETNRGTLLTDLLADLMHLAACCPGVQFDSALETARTHYATEFKREAEAPARWSRQRQMMVRP